LYDLLQDPERNKNLRIRENKLYGIFVEGLAEFIVENIQDCFLLLSRGETNRAVRQTRFNHQSSRSHTIFQLLIESDKANKRGVLKKAKINFCDLAGSEKYDKDNKMVSEYVKELTQINKSLSTLGKVISALGKGINNHVPYRDSKLTRLLQDSLGVNTRTILIATISPAPQYVEESISTLKFADRAKQILVKLKKMKFQPQTTKS
jgi:Kinesin-like protein